MFHPPPTKFRYASKRHSTTSRVQQYIDAYRCPHSPLLPFLPGVFFLDEQNVVHCHVEYLITKSFSRSFGISTHFTKSRTQQSTTVSPKATTTHCPKATPLQLAWTLDMASAIRLMHALLQEHDDNQAYNRFLDFYFLTSSFGSKQDLDLFHNCVESHLFDVRVGDKIDIGFDFALRNVDPAHEGHILLFHQDRVRSIPQQYLLPSVGGDLTVHPQFLSSFGGIQYHNDSAPLFSKVIMYSSFKNDFSPSKKYGRNDDDYHPYMVHQGMPTITNLLNRTLKRLARNASVEQTARVEARLVVTPGDFNEAGSFVGFTQAGRLEDFVSRHIMHASRPRAGPSPMVCVNSNLYTTYLSSYLTFARLMLAHFRNRNDAGALTGVLILCYLLSSVFHSPPKNLNVGIKRAASTSVIKRFINRYRCRHNPLLVFLPGVFRLDEGNRLHCNVVFNDATLQRFFSDYVPVSYAAPLESPFSGRQVDLEIESALLAILPDNLAMPTPDAAIQFDSSHTRSTPHGTTFVDEFRLAIDERGIDSNFAVRVFVRLLFRDYFLQLPKDIFKNSAARPTLQYLTAAKFAGTDLDCAFAVQPFSEQKMSHNTTQVRMQSLMPYFESNATAEDFQKFFGYTKVNKLTMRSYWIQLCKHTTTTDPQISHAQMRRFCLKALCVIFLYTDHLPLVPYDKPFQRLPRHTRQDPKAKEFREHTLYKSPSQETHRVIDPHADIEPYAVGSRGRPPLLPGVVGEEWITVRGRGRGRGRSGRPRH
ncbi:hypothetical protein MBANPS3_000387 [Mucor bainieri]